MRYWIYWNDLVQGPFELEELTALKALSEDLPVCLEDRTDWLPACRIADLAPVIEHLRSYRMPPPPPPPPPSGPPVVEPIQGEFFTEPSGQKSLFPDITQLKGPFALSDNELQMNAAYTDVYFTAPFHFQGGAPSASTATLSRPISSPAPRETFEIYTAPPLASTLPPISKESTAVDFKNMEAETLAEPAKALHIPLEIYPDTPEPVQERPAVAALTDTLPPLSLESPEEPTNLRLVGWIAGILVGLLLLVSAGYKWFDLSTSRAAIIEAKTHALKNTAVPVSTNSMSVLNPPPMTEAPKSESFLHTIIHKLRSLFRSKKTVAGSVAPVPPIPPVVQTPAPIVAAPPLVPLPPTLVPVATAQNLSSDIKPVKKKLRKKGAHKSVVVPLVATPAAAVSGQDVSVEKAKPETPKPQVKAPSAPAAPLEAMPAPVAAVVPAVPLVPGMNTAASKPTAVTTTPPDPWIGRHNDAIALVMNKKISTPAQTIGDRARVMLEEMHDKELLHAADTGQRLYLPDKIAWSALREGGAVYRVYLGFSADQANGERVQSMSYQFQADLENKTVKSDDSVSLSEFMNAQTALVHKRDPRAADIENILSAVDLLNKHRMRAVIVKKSRKNRTEEKNIDQAIKAAGLRLQKAMAYFRTKYPEVMLKNIAQAYNFAGLLKDNV